MSAGRKVRGLSDEWAQHQLDLLELAETVCSAMDVPVELVAPERVAAAEQARAHLEYGNETVTEQDPACRWAHGVVQELDARGECPVCADDEGDA